MLRRTTKIQLVLFVVITLVGISYVSAEYIGLTKYIFNNSCTVKADFPSSGGIFTNAEVTYRGVTVGKVGSLQLVSKTDDLPAGGIRVDLELDNCGSPKIPSNSTANVTNRSVVGEQYVNLIPPVTDKSTGPNPYSGPYLQANDRIPASSTSVPTPTQKLLLDLNDLITSVPLGDLKTTVTELDAAVAGRGPDLGSLLDSTNSLLATASQPDNLSATLNLIKDSSTVLQTQLDVQSPLQSYTHSLNLLSQQLKASDPDIRRLLDNGSTDFNTVTSFIKNNQTDLAVTLNNLITTGTLLVRHLDGIQEIFQLYPALAAGGQGVLQNKEGKLALILQAVPSPQDCGDPTKDQEGYNGTVRRTPDKVTAIAPNVSVRCTAPLSSGTNIRGSAQVPGGDPISLAGGGTAYPRVATSNTTAKASTSSTTSAPNPIQIGPPATGTPQKADPRYVSLLTSALQ